MMTSVELFFDTSSDESSYEEQEDINIVILRIRRQLRDKCNPLDLESKIFIKNFGLSKEAFSALLREIDDKLRLIKRQRAVPNIIKLAVVLRFCANGKNQSDQKNDINLGLAQSTVSGIFKEVFQILETYVCPKWIKFRFTEEEQRKASKYFYQKTGIPNIVGCVDGTHVKIISPKQDIKHLYYNNMGFYSINTMIVCDDSMQIRYINGKHPGGYFDDSDVWNLSALNDKFMEDYRSGCNSVRILGDEEYPLTPYLLTPFRNAKKGSLQEKFNKKHLEGRNIIEKTIRALKSRFKCLSVRELHYTPEKATQIINVCAALYNISVKFKVENPEIENYHICDAYLENKEMMSDNSDESELDIDSESIEFKEGNRVRDNLLSFMENNLLQ